MRKHSGRKPKDHSFMVIFAHFFRCFPGERIRYGGFTFFFSLAQNKVLMTPSWHRGISSIIRKFEHPSCRQFNKKSFRRNLLLSFEFTTIVFHFVNNKRRCSQSCGVAKLKVCWRGTLQMASLPAFPHFYISPVCRLKHTLGFVPLI